MRARKLTVLLLIGIGLTAGACATSEEWAEWKKHPSHFASGDHLFFSFRHTEGTPPHVTKRDVELARSEKWWGKVITVSPEQIFAD